MSDYEEYVRAERRVGAEAMRARAAQAAKLEAEEAMIDLAQNRITPQTIPIVVMNAVLAVPIDE